MLYLQEIRSAWNVYHSVFLFYVRQTPSYLSEVVDETFNCGPDLVSAYPTRPFSEEYQDEFTDPFRDKDKLIFRMSKLYKNFSHYTALDP